jgi:hypothetical protein
MYVVCVLLLLLLLLCVQAAGSCSWVMCRAASRSLALSSSSWLM